MNRQLSSSDLSNFGKLSFMNEELKDLTIIVDTEKFQWKFCAHKLVLSCASSYFRNLLKDEKVQEITLNCVTPSTVYLLMRYIYCGDLQTESWNVCLDLLQAAYTYEINELVQKCGKLLENVITLSNVCYIYDKASKCLLSSLQHKCCKIILDAGFIVLKTQAFELLNERCLLDIISSYNLNINTESIVFDALFRWARLECCRKSFKITEMNIATLIQPFLQHVCVDDMSDAEKSAIPTLILTQVEPNNHTRINFSVPDSLLAYAYYLKLETDYNRFDFVGEKMVCIRFSVNFPIHLIGMHFTVIGRTTPCSFIVNIMKENIPSTNLMSQNTFDSLISCTRINQKVWNNFHVKCRKPLVLKPLNIYNIYIEDPEMEIQVPQTKLPDSVVSTPGGYVNFTIHAEYIWGITCLVLI